MCSVEAECVVCDDSFMTEGYYDGPECGVLPKDDQGRCPSCDEPRCALCDREIPWPNGTSVPTTYYRLFGGEVGWYCRPDDMCDDGRETLHDEGDYLRECGWKLAKWESQWPSERACWRHPYRPLVFKHHTEAVRFSVEAQAFVAAVPNLK